MITDTPPVYRFAPSPNGYLHLGHALSALLNFDAAQANGGTCLLRIEDIDPVRSRAGYVDAIGQDLAWLGLRWPEPVRRQSEHFSDYRQRIDDLRARGLVYPCACSRHDVALAVAEREKSGPWPRDPDGVPLYPGTCRHRKVEATAVAWRLDMARATGTLSAPLTWREQPSGETAVDRVAAPEAWGDVVLARKDVPTSYHLSVVHDDAVQAVTHVIRGADLGPATAIHRLLQTLFGLPTPIYWHHRLVTDEDGEKLSKSRQSQALRDLRRAGLRPADIRARLGLPLHAAGAQPPQPEHGRADAQQGRQGNAR